MKNKIESMEFGEMMVSKKEFNLLKAIINGNQDMENFVKSLTYMGYAMYDHLGMYAFKNFDAEDPRYVSLKRILKANEFVQIYRMTKEFDALILDCFNNVFVSKTKK